MEIEGICDERFISAKRAFKKNFDLGLEVGASFAVSWNGKLVVDLWGGFPIHPNQNHGKRIL